MLLEVKIHQCRRHSAALDLEIKFVDLEGTVAWSGNVMQTLYK